MPADRTSSWLGRGLAISILQGFVLVIGTSALLHMKAGWSEWATSARSLRCHCHYYWCPFFQEIPHRFYFLLTELVDKFVFVNTAADYYSKSFGSSLMTIFCRFTIVLLPSSSSVWWSPSVLGLAEHEFRFVLLPSDRTIRSCPWIPCRPLHSN